MGQGLYYKLASAATAVVLSLNLLSACSPKNNGQIYDNPTNTQPAITQTYKPSETPFQPVTDTPYPSPTATLTAIPSPTATWTATATPSLEELLGQPTFYVANQKGMTPCIEKCVLAPDQYLLVQFPNLVNDAKYLLGSGNKHIEGEYTDNGIIFRRFDVINLINLGIRNPELKVITSSGEEILYGSIYVGYIAELKPTQQPTQPSSSDGNGSSAGTGSGSNGTGGGPGSSGTTGSSGVNGEG